MVELKTNAKALLDQARPEFSPSAQQLEALQARLTASAASELEPVTQGSRGLRYLMLALGLGVLATGAAVLSTGDETAAPKVTAATSERSRPRQDVVPPPARQLPTKVVPTIEPTPTPEPGPPVEQPPPTTKTRPSERASHRAPSRVPPPPPAPKQSLADELALIAQARRDLKAEHFAAAQRLSTEYLDTFAEGSFREEAEVLTLVAACSLGRTSSLMERARTYTSDKSSAFAQRVRAACLELD